MIRQLAAAILVGFIPSSALAQTVFAIDAAAPAPPPATGHLDMGSGQGPSGTIGINSRYLTRDGRPWFPVMGEFHFSRYPEQEWDVELGKMKAQGIGVVASYVIWNQIELEPGRLDWTGSRNLRRFIELCRKHGLLFYLRPGPWAHAETRFGGIPDWVVARGRLRSDDPVYLTAVERLFRGVADQVAGLLWKDGGPVIGLQIENEYNLVGPGRGAGHVATLKRMARRVGLDVPLYTVTGWDRAVYPRGAVVPVFGGYPDEPWARATDKLPPRENYLFRFDSRVSGDLGAQTVNASKGPADADLDRDLTPFLGAEYGPGIPTMYRRRPIIRPVDVQAQMVTQLGSGLNLMGYYMFHGGANPLAAGRGLEEVTRTGSFNDVPIVGYDFQAPLGQYGERRPVADLLRPLHLFLHAFGERLAPMTVRRPVVLPRNAADTGVLRHAVRSDGKTGFLFVNNHIRQYPMPGRSRVRFDVKLGGETLRVGGAGVTIAGDAAFFWPLRMDLAGVRLAWATAQPVTMVTDRTGPVFVFMATPGVQPAFAFDVGTVVDGASRMQDGKIVAAPVPSADRPFAVRSPDGRHVRILVLSEADGRRLWVGSLGGRDRLVLSDADVRFEAGGVALSGPSPTMEARIFPRVAIPSEEGVRSYGAGAMSFIAVSSAPRPIVPVAVTMVRPPETAPAVRIGGPAKAAVQPLPEAYGTAGAWEFTIPAGAIAHGRTFLQIDYAGDVGRLFDGDTLLDDRFWDGRRWDLSLDRFSANLGRPWTMTVLPMRADAPIYLDDIARTRLGGRDQVAEITSAKLVPQYERHIKVFEASNR